MPPDNCQSLFDEPIAEKDELPSAVFHWNVWEVNRLHRSADGNYEAFGLSRTASPFARLALSSLALVLATVPRSESSPPPTTPIVNNLILLSNSHVELGVLAEAGGRVALFRRPAGKNVLLSDPTRWERPEQMVPQPEPMADFTPFNGHINWVGPQKGWWSQQQVAPERSGNWPPDPYLLYGRFQTIEHSPDQLVLRGPISPVTGLQLQKSFALASDGTVRLRVVATNRREESVSWGLWSNTRLPARVPFLAAIDTDGDFRFESEHSQIDAVASHAYSIREGWFSFSDATLPGWASVQTGKAYFAAKHGAFIAFPSDDLAFVKRFDAPAAEHVAPGQSPVEVYKKLQQDDAESLLELEFHGEYRTLQPGDSLVLEESWQLLPVAPALDDAQRRAWARQLLTAPPR